MLATGGTIKVDQGNLGGDLFGCQDNLEREGHPLG